MKAVERASRALPARPPAARAIDHLLRPALFLALFLALLAAFVPPAAQAQGQARVPAALAPDDCTIRATGDDPAPRHARPHDPWIFRGTDIPVDSEWLMGELPNGLRYAVRQNGVPPCQIALRVRIDAGSLHEEDHERGYAHLIEHLTFRQSRDFGPGEAIVHFQRLGAALGADTNAMTTPTQTVFKLDLPNADRAKLIEGVRGFAGMIREPALSAANIAADLPIVLAERRDMAGPARRISDATQAVFFAGQRLADRAPIGTLEALQAASPQSVRAFHDRWYRPENTVVVLVGAAEPHLLAALIEREFGDWAGKGPPVPAPDFGAPQAPAASDIAGEGGAGEGGAGEGGMDVPVGQVDVIVEPGQPRTLTFAVMRPFVQVVDNIEYNRGVLLDSLALSILNLRLESRAREGASFLFAQAQRDKISRSVDGTYVTLAPLTPDWRAALADVRGLIADALANPPSQAEIDRAASGFELAFVDMVEQARIQAGARLADDIVTAVDIREAVAAPQTFLDVFRSARDRLTPDVLLHHTRRMFDGVVVRAILLSPEAGDARPDQLFAALSKPVAADGAARLDAGMIDFARLPVLGDPGAVSSRGPLAAIPDAEVVVFDNGARALLFARDNEPGRVTVRVRFGAGWRGFAPDEAVYARLGQMALVNSGLGPLDQNDLDRLAAGRKLSFDFRIDDGVFTFEGSTRAQDLADQLYLFAAKLALPRWDERPVLRAIASAAIAHASYESDPSGVINRDLDWLLRARDPRFATPSPADLEAASPARFREVWSRLLAQGPIEVAVFGDFDRGEAIEALARTFGALPQREALPAAVRGQEFAFPASTISPVVLGHGGDPDQAAAVIAWPTGGGAAGLVRSRKLDLLSRVLANRLVDNLRERSGAAYSPQVSAAWPLDMQTGGMLFALVQVEPGLIDAFFEEAGLIVDDLAQNGPSADELARVVEPIKQYIARAQTGHTFWLDHLEGAAFDPERAIALRSLYRDYAEATPAEMQAVARQYLLAHGGFRLAVVPRARGVPAP